MLVDGNIPPGIAESEQSAVALEAAGYDGAWSQETGHDPFLSLVPAALATTRLQLGTGIAVAFARNPMVVATMANDLQLASGGRFLLGLGSQVRAHIQKRYSMPWSHPAPRMREFVLALRAIWSAWNDRAPLDFRGEFYTHTLMTPFFDPGPNPFGPPKVFVAAVGERMTEVVGEVADGLLVHGFTTERYLREATHPALERGLARSGRQRSDLELSYPAFVVTGTDGEGMDQARRAVAAQVAFYASTPAYRPVLELHGWGDLQAELNALVRQGRWEDLGNHLPSEVLDAFALSAEPDAVAPGLLARYGELVDRLSLYAPYPLDPEVQARIVAGLREAA
jgi:probable F420-dependent oxidoreductase